MLYVGVELPIPEGALIAGKGLEYVYLKLGPSSRGEDKKLKHNKMLIGKLSETSNFFHPNDNYYKKIGMPPPLDVKAVKKGRQPKEKLEISYGDLNEYSKIGLGYSIACYYIAKEIKLLECLEDTFNVQFSRHIIAIASFFMREEKCSTTLLDIFCLKNLLFTDKIITSQRASEIFASIRDDEIASFFRKWIACNQSTDHVFYDVTSMSGYSTTITEFEFGYNRDDEHLQQINIGVFASQMSRLPLFYSHYQGSINDFTNLPNILSYAYDLGLDDKFTIVADGIFSEGKSVNFCNYKGYKIIVGVPVKCNSDVRNKILDWRRSDTTISDTFSSMWPLHYSSRENKFEINNVHGRLIMYRSHDRHDLERCKVTEDVNILKMQLKQNNIFESNPPTRIKKYCKIKVDDSTGNRKYILKLDNDKIKDELNLCGCFALFTTDTAINHENCLKTYREKDICEKFFDNLKNDIIDGRIHVHAQETLIGKMFVVFVSLILRMAFHRKLHNIIKSNKISLKYCYELLDLVKCIKSNNKWKLVNAITKKQREILTELGLPIDILKATIMD